MNAIAVLASLVVLATIIARGADHPTRPREEGMIALIRLHAEKVALLLVGAAAGSVLLSTLAGLKPPGEVVALTSGTALWMLTHPAGWWRYVVKGREPACEEARPDP